MLWTTWMFMGSMIAPINAKYQNISLKFFYETLEQKHFCKHILFQKVNQIFWFTCCITGEDLSIDASITTVRLILANVMWFLFSGYGQTDRHDFGIPIWKHVSTQKNSTQSSKLGVMLPIAIWMHNKKRRRIFLTF